MFHAALVVSVTEKCSSLVPSLISFVLFLFLSNQWDPRPPETLFTCLSTNVLTRILILIKIMEHTARNKTTYKTTPCPRRRWVKNIKMDLREIGWNGMDWMDLAQDRDQWRSLVNTEMNLRVP
jgi:hypothetical protein